jgi:CheY-like chemotaxis protein/nitrogen-specific signal transduction histidine kinase
MAYAARTLVEVIVDPAALLDADGRVLVANTRWSQEVGAGGVHAPEGAHLPGPTTDCPAHAALLCALQAVTPGAAPVVVRCRCAASGELTVRVAGVECDDGTRRHLVTTARPAPQRLAVAGDPDPVAQAKSEFLALLGHEIRTPVTAVVGMVDLLRALPLQQEVREVVDDVHRSTHALKALTDDLLDLARLETGRLEFRQQPVELRPLLEGVIEPLQQQTRQKGILLLAALAPDLPAGVLGDPDRLRQVLTSLVGNAVKFTDRGEVVITAARDDAGRLLIAVRDTGLGLGEHDRARIFAPFVQTDSSAARRHEGAGLGLALAARLVHGMGGTIDVESQLGHGSAFHVRLPLVPAQVCDGDEGRTPLAGRRVAVVAPSASSAQALTWLLNRFGAEAVSARLDDVIARVPDVDTVLWCDDSHDPEAVKRADAVLDALGPTRRAIMISTTDPRHGLVRRPGVITAPLVSSRLLASLNQERTGVRGAPITVPPLSGGRVLLAEDNDVNRNVFRRMIELLGVECHAVGDGAAAAEAVLGDGRYDVVLMDVQMPGTDGLEATRRIRAGGGRTPILALTATGLQGDRERCLQAGMDGHLSKPITLPELRRALEPYLEPKVAEPAEAAAPSPDAQPAAPIGVDLGRLRDLEEQLADRALVVTTVRMFLSQLDGRRAALAAALERHDREALRATAHLLKSSSALLGADALAGACGRIEQRAMVEATEPELTALVAEVERAVTGTLETMAGYLAETGGAR